MEGEKQESQKTVVSFIVGLLLGGLLVWAFSGPTPDANKVEEKKEEKKEVTEGKTLEIKTDNKKTETEVVKETPKLEVGEGKITILEQTAGKVVKLESATYPVSEGWIGVRDHANDKLGGLLGVVRFSEEQGLVPKDIILQRETKAGQEYAVVIFKENGDRDFNIAEDVQIDAIFAKFTAK